MENTSGIYPCGDRILVKPDKIEKKGLIEIPDTITGKHMEAQISGVLVAVGPDAWTHYVKKGPSGTEVSGYSGPYAKVGDKVMFAKYGGINLEGKDGELYRVLNDDDLLCKVDEGVTFSALETRAPMSKK
jgi:chaperonin GroES